MNRLASKPIFGSLTIRPERSIMTRAPSDITDRTRSCSAARAAISYCGLCGDEKRSAEKVLRTPLSKQRNKHIQHVLVEAANLAPKQSRELALVYERAKEKGNANRATIAVARKMVTYLLAADRANRPFVPAEARNTAA